MFNMCRYHRKEIVILNIQLLYHSCFLLLLRISIGNLLLVVTVYTGNTMTAVKLLEIVF